MFHIGQCLQRNYRIVGKNIRMKSQHRSLHQWRQPAPLCHHLCPVSLLARSLHQWRRPVSLLPSYHRSPLPLVAGYISVPVTSKVKSVSHRGWASDSGIPHQLEINPWWQKQIEINADETHLDEADEVEEVEGVDEHGVEEVEMDDAVKEGKDSDDTYTSEEDSGRIVTVARLNDKEEQVVKPEEGKERVDIKWTPDSGVRLSMVAEKHLNRLAKVNPGITLEPNTIKFKPYSTNEVVPVLGKLDVTMRNKRGADHRTQVYVVEGNHESLLGREDAYALGILNFDPEGKPMDKDGVEEVAICPHCGVGFSNESALQEHIDKTDTQQVGGCDVLRKAKNEKEILAGKKIHICEICELGFDTIRALRQHRLIHSNSNDFKCEECGKTYRREASLNRHLKYYHSSDLKFACPECKKTFRMKCDMMRHMRTVCIPELKNHKCGQCNKKFADNLALIEHIKLFHNPEHKFKCDKCEYTFATNRKLLNHIKAIHEYDRPHQCEDCGAAFKSTRDLNHHQIRMHTFDWPHNCEVCGEQGIKKGFLFPNELKRHMMVHHATEYQDQLETEKPAVCDKCNIRFSTVQQLNNHYRKIHFLWTKSS